MALFSFTKIIISLQKTLILVKHHFPFVNPCCPTLNHLLVLNTFGDGFQEDLLNYLHRDWSEAEKPHFTGKTKIATKENLLAYDIYKDHLLRWHLSNAAAASLFLWATTRKITGAGLSTFEGRYWGSHFTGTRWRLLFQSDKFIS